MVIPVTGASSLEALALGIAHGLPEGTLVAPVQDARRRKPAPRVDPALVLAVGRIGGNLNQIARFVNGYKRLPLAYREDLDTIRTGLDAVLAELTAIREALDALDGKPRP